MRIRKRSIAVLSSSTPSPSWETTCTSNSTSHGDNEEEGMEKEKQDFLFPLVVAVMDVQAKAEAQVLGYVEPQKTPATDGSEIESGVNGRMRQRPALNWRNALLRFEEENELFKIGVEDDKLNYRRTRIMRNAGDQFEPLTSPACAREGIPKSTKEEFSGRNRKRELPSSGGFEKTFKSKEEDLGLFTVKTKPIDCPTKCDTIQHPNAGRKDYSDANCSQTAFQNDNPKRKTKLLVSDKDDDNNHGGSRCRRRNGRGWRCSQRTLVGYSLCEHHLGKSRFKSINSSKGLVPTTSKGSKFKELHLIHAASCKVDI